MANIQAAVGALTFLFASVALVGCTEEGSKSAADASTGPDGASSDFAATTDGGADRCQTTILGCQKVVQGGVVVPLRCNETVKSSSLGQAVCVTALECDSNHCLTRVAPCFPECAQDAGANPPEAGVVPSHGLLGAPCTSGADCGNNGLICLKPTDNLSPDDPSQGGPPNGLCTTPCTRLANPDPCFDLGGICVVLASPTSEHPDPAGYCWETCTADEGAATKCHNRADVACNTGGWQPGKRGGAWNVLDVCVFVCTGDSDCDTRRCSDTCVDQLPDGAALGGACRDNTSCSSRLCIYGFALAGSFCSRYCRSGDTSRTCGFRDTPIASGPGPVGGCVKLDFTTQDGDLGWCQQLCDVSSDCPVGGKCYYPPTLWPGNHGACVLDLDGGATPPIDSGDAADTGVSSLPGEAGP